ncbi:MAG TPA: radical SAM protein [Chlorobaculum parvum]|uniref:Radical SAM protein n=1 Tax=Chlorobaculum parvum TaxID=274539 RepID=A0A7C5HHS6_9CHLB|nr:radical SAM protein [Chlorobaculum parvum]
MQSNRQQGIDMSKTATNPYFSTRAFSLTRQQAIGQIDIELTERCNNDCLHCCINQPADSTTAKSREMDTVFVKSILDQAAKLGALSVRFTGGEPLLRDDFRELYLHSRRLGMKVLLFTNARLLDTGLADLFARIPPLEQIQITLYGITKESCSAVTRDPLAYKETMRGIELLRERNIPFIVKGALMPQNAADKPAIEAFALDIPWQDGRKPSFASAFDLRSRRDFEKRNALIRHIRATPEEVVRLLREQADEKYFLEMQQFCAKFMGASGEKLFSCGAGKEGGCVDAYGMLQPCLLLRDPTLVYDLKKGSLLDGVRDFFPMLQELKVANAEYLKRCARCFINGLCEQCPARSWSENGTLDTPVEYLCDIAHATARFLGLIGEKENAWEVSNPSARIAKLQQTTYAEWAAEQGVANQNIK